ncbi:MAG: prolipoprotein diacylglyceryl transferase [Candidatus Andersenbacteria bacterium]
MIALTVFPTRTIALDLFGISIYWYGLLYLAAFVLGWWLLPRLQKYRDLRLTPDDALLIIVVAMAGVLLGGRLGYVAWYNPQYFLEHPGEIVRFWQGGMASHGGFIGVAVALYFTARHLNVSFWRLTDVVVVPIALGLALGRLGNFINQELYGTLTTLPWGIDIPGVAGKRHPTQLYAVIKNVLIAATCYHHLRRPNTKLRPGQTTAFFLLMYSTARFLLEYLRVPDAPLVAFGPLTLTQGQCLTLPLFGFGLWLYYTARRKALVSNTIEKVPR